MPRSFVEIDVLLPLADREDARNTCDAVTPYLEGKDCRVHVIHVVQKNRHSVDTVAVEERTDALFAIARECFDATGIPVSSDVRYGQNVGQTILDAAEEYSVASIVLTPRDRSFWRKLRSQNVVGTLAKRAQQPVIIIPADV